MPTLEAIVSDMLTRVPADALGREVGITSLTTTTCVCNALATGTVSAQKFINKWLWRHDTATAADRFRVCSNFAASTGTLTHAGSNYADTTATGETVFVLEYDPNFYIDAIQRTLGRTRYSTIVEVPVAKQGDTHVIPYTWLTKPSDIEQISFTTSPVVSTNRYFHHWGALQSTGGTLAPDDWALTGTAATIARVGTPSTLNGPYAAELTRSTNNCYIRQTIPFLGPGVIGDSLEGETVMVVVVGRASSASQLRCTITSGATTSSSSYHSGDGGWEELSTSITVPSTATSILIDVECNGTDGAVQIDECYAVRETSTVTTAMERNKYPEQVLTRNHYKLEQVGNKLLIRYNAASYGQFLVTATRPYPTFDSARIVAGSADADSTDCPLEVVSVGAIAHLFEGLAQRPGEDATRYGQLANEWGRRYERVALSHLLRTSERSGFDIPRPYLFAAPAGRW